MAVPTLGGTCLTRARQPLTQPPPMSIYMREGTSISTSHRHSHQAPRSSHIGHHHQGSHRRDGLGSSRPTPGHGPGWPTCLGQRTESLVGTQKGLHLWALQAPVVERIGEVVDVVLEVLGFLVRKVLVLGVVIVVHPGGEGRDRLCY